MTSTAAIGQALPSPGATSDIECTVVGYAAVQAAADHIDQMRRDSETGEVLSLRTTLRKHADEQTVLALTAVARVITRFELADRSFTEWSVIAAPQFLGRVTSAVALTKYQRSGPRAVTPQVIVHQSSHSVSSAVSVALGCHGQNMGVGGGRAAWQQGFLAACSLINQPHVPGLWLIFTGWDVEPIPHTDGRIESTGVCHAVALALVPSRDMPAGPRLSFAWNAENGHPSRLTGVAQLADRLSTSTDDWSCNLDGGLRVAWRHPGASAT